MAAMANELRTIRLRFGIENGAFAPSLAFGRAGAILRGLFVGYFRIIDPCPRQRARAQKKLVEGRNVDFLH